MEQHILKGRHFQFWHYVVSHGQLLIRSPMDEEHATNVDLWFWDVRYIELPDMLGEIELVEPTTSEHHYLKQRIGERLLDDSLVTVVLAGKQRYFVVSHDRKLEKNQLNMFEKPYKTSM